MRYWHWSQRRSYCSMPPFQEVLEEFEGIQKSVFFSLLVISQLKSIHLSRCVHIPERSAMHQKWYEPALCQKWGRLSDQSAQGVKQVLQQNPRAAQRRLRLHHHWLVSRTILIICRRVLRLSLVVARFPSCRLCGVLFCADLLVLSQLLSEWGLTHPAFGPLFPPRALDWRAFCWQPLTLPPGQRHLSWAVVDHLFAPGAQEGPSPRHWSYVAWAGPLCERTMYRGIPWEWNRKNLISNVFSSGGGRTNLFGWKPPADISTFVTDSA